MWYLELLVFVLSILTIASVELPWSIMVHEHMIEPNCMLANGFQFKLWGTACGLSWEELKLIRQHSYFAFVNVVTVTRIYNIVVAIMGILLMFYVIFKGTQKQVLLMTSLVMAVVTVISLSEYVNEMQTTMTLPPQHVFIQGPGYMVFMASAGVAGSIFFTEFFINFYKLSYCEKPIGECVPCNFLAYVISALSVSAAFGELMQVEKCKDYVTPIDLNTCPYCNSPLIPIVTIFGVMSFITGIGVYVSVKYFYSWTKIVNFMSFLNMVMLGTTLGLTYSFENFKSPGYGIYVAFVAIGVNVLFLTVYNHVIDLMKLKDLVV